MSWSCNKYLTYVFTKFLRIINILSLYPSVLVERVFMRIVMAETDEKLENALKTFLAPVLLKLASTNEAVKNKVGLVIIINVIDWVSQIFQIQ